MPGMHTVEKIGGTSMSRFGEVMKNVIIGRRKGSELYNRVFIVSAYGGITNLLLENKKTGAPGVYGEFAANNPNWVQSLENVRTEMLKFNKSFAEIGLDLKKADAFVNERLDAIKNCLEDLVNLRSYGHIRPDQYLPATREFLSAIGEAHSAYNSALILQANNVNASFIDLTGWKDSSSHTLDSIIMQAFRKTDFSKELPIVTGYVKFDGGIMTHFDRGYSEITFSKVAVLTDAREGIIHKEYHLSTGDPVLIGTDKVKVIGNTNFDIADQLADMDMEAIHSKASKEMELKNIPIRVKNTFEPDHEGTLIGCNYVSPNPRVEMICGRNDLIAIEITDPEMVGESGYDYRLCESLAHFSINYIAKNTNANTITHYIPERSKNTQACIERIKQKFPSASVETRKVGIVSVIGSNMKIPGFLSRAADALAEAKINVLALDQCMRQVNMQFVIERDEFKKAIISLHREFVEKA
ncbi:MAG: aspartate kinase [Lentisphaerae bacterium GWF2_52_8]|nr:MAG: aspartate kinase [Lentisphaerae bacterium GWF2_52_8]